MDILEVRVVGRSMVHFVRSDQLEHDPLFGPDGEFLCPVPELKAAVAICGRYSKRWVFPGDEALEACEGCGVPPREPERQTSASTTIYFIQAETGPIKIGQTDKLAERVKALQTASHDALELLGSYQATKADERRLHARFRNYRMRGEWFRPGDDLLAFISEVCG